MRTIWLRMRMTFCIMLMFALIYALLTVIMFATGMSSPIFFALLAFLIVLAQYMIGPKIVEKTMRVKYVSETEASKLHSIVNDLAMRADIQKPKIGISEIPIANAFAFGKSKKDGRVCVTRMLLDRLNEKELRAVLGHELSHIKHKDIVAITMLSVIPMICYFVYISFFWSSFFRRRSGATVAIALIALLTYFLTNMLVLYASRVREYYADQRSVELTHDAPALASALYRITMEDARADRRTLKQVEGMKAFFASDPSTSRKDLTDLRQADLNRDGHLDKYEVEAFAKESRVRGVDRIMEIFSSHPNIVKRIKRLHAISTPY
ncbi:MAG: zinc metalloprotease HtpX [Thermoplasmatales archaeon]|nr:zinc metalloprotease HtpX [Thermoplasmatales archaeon]